MKLIISSSNNTEVITKIILKYFDLEKSLKIIHYGLLSFAMTLPSSAFLLKSIRFLILLLPLFLLSGCNKIELLSGLHENEANQMMALLLENGVECEKLPGAEGTFILHVESDSFARSVEILKEHGFPRANYQGVGDVFAKSGLVSSPSEERIRFMNALSQDIAGTIALIDGVLNAQVHIVLPNNNPFVQDAHPSSAAVFISYRPDSNVQGSVSLIKNLVLNSVEGLSYDKISVALFPASIKTVPASHKSSAKDNPLALLAGGILLLALIGGGVFAWLKMSKKNPTPAA